MQPTHIKASYKEWRRKLLAASRNERLMLGCGRTKGTVARLMLAYDIRARRRSLKIKEGLAP